MDVILNKILTHMPCLFLSSPSYFHLHAAEPPSSNYMAPRLKNVSDQVVNFVLWSFSLKTLTKQDRTPVVSSFSKLDQTTPPTLRYHVCAETLKKVCPGSLAVLRPALRRALVSRA